ncbi:serine/threonine protein kinase [Herbaspirillum sp. VT-16-41]|uniref:protein kinase domain-containing protein n=1 Tax=Herbaspirillum sp. VT-16-41 TaxID=1953765 RepID=UPI000981DF9A|nr:serine/threonine protein kinase [Herbaspirillum sp. VT-16-41]
MNDMIDTGAPEKLTDEYGNLHQLADEIARGGQGAVYRTGDADLAIKLALNEDGSTAPDIDLQQRFQDIRLLPIPARPRVSLPLAILRGHPGYVMHLLNGMSSFASFEITGKSKRELQAVQPVLPDWLAGTGEDAGWRLLHYARTGSTRRRLFALSACAAILARLHSTGLVYGDLSPNNAFTASGDCPEVWLIDADNLAFERHQRGAGFFTPGYGAPELLRGDDAGRATTDCWSLAVMVFRTLSLCHPFLGRKVHESDDDSDGWDNEESTANDAGQSLNAEERAYAGEFPFIQDEHDDSNRGNGDLPGQLIATPSLRHLFQEAFGPGRKLPHRRPTAAIWARELARAHDLSIDCPSCSMSYFADDAQACPYCGVARPALVRASTPGWTMVMPATDGEWALPHRLLHPFSCARHHETEHEVIVKASARKVDPVRGTKPLPPQLSFDFLPTEP